jgi:hypothetical protein
VPGLCGGTRPVFKQFAWLEADSVKLALSRPTHATQRVSPKEDNIASRWAAIAKLDQLVKEKQNDTESVNYLFYIGRNKIYGCNQIRDHPGI